MPSSVIIGKSKLILNTKSIGSAPIVKELLSFPGQRVISFYDSKKIEETFNLCPLQLVSVTNKTIYPIVSSITVVGKLYLIYLVSLCSVIQCTPLQ